jgi:ribosome recycling factor
MQHALLVAGRQSIRPRLPLLTSLALARYASKSAGNSKRQRGKQAKDEVEVQPKGSKQKGVQTLDQLVPGSQQVLSGDALAEYKKTEEKMDATIQFYRKEVSSLESLAVGRVTPDVLKPVRVSLPDSDPDAPPLKLHEVATVGVRDGTNLIVTVFDESVCV